MRHFAVALVLLSTAGCLRVPDPIPAEAGVLPDAGPPPPPPPFEVTGWSVADQTGAGWPADAAPRAPTIRVELSQAPKVDADEDPPIWLLDGAADADLLDDLESAPLRIATRERIVATDVALDRRAWTLRPRERLRAGAEYAIAIGPWLESARDGERLGEAWTASLVVSAAPEAGAEVAASWPADGAAAVAPAIRELAVRFDGPVSGVSEGLVLREGERAIAATAAAVPCPEVGWPDGWCARLVPDAALARGAAHRLVVGEAVIDATGAPVGPWEARFATALEPDVTPPMLLPMTCALDEVEHALGCVFADDARVALAITADEPVRVRFTLAGRELYAVAPRGSARLEVDGFPPDTPLSGVLRIEDAAGLDTTRPVSVATLPRLAAVSIVEVRADPLGREPGQEYVEVLNFGAVPVDLAGFALSDRADAIGDVIARPVSLAPGQRALLVADPFDPDDPEDVPVPPGVLLVRVGTSLASGGLSNAGEPLFLRDAEGRRISAAPALAAPNAGACIVRIGDAMRSGDAALFSGGPCTPGTAP